MLARDINSNPTQYRTWVVPTTPDFTGQLYTGLKSGTNAFEDVVPYIITDDTVVADFNLPLPSHWTPDLGDAVADWPVRKTLPATIEDSHLAIIDGYAYMFGGKITDKIYKAHLNNPADWVDTGAVLPTPLYGAALAIISGTIYLFGGHDGYDGYDGYGGYGLGVGTIFSAPTTNPLSWTNHGTLLPSKLYYSSLGMSDGYLHLFGGLKDSGATSTIFTATTAAPLVWTDSGSHIPVPLYGSVLAQVDGYWMMYGGLASPINPSRYIFRAATLTPTSWSLDGYLPYATAHGQFFTVGHDGYLIGPMVGAAATGFTPILQCHLSTPNAFMDTRHVVRGVVSHSQMAMIYDRAWLFGGSGETAIFACNQNIKLQFTNPTVQAYGQITRVLLPLTNNLVNPYQALCFPYWKSDYKL